MLLRDRYFTEAGHHPPDDLSQGYFTFTYPADTVSEAIIEAAKSDPSLLDQDKPDETLIAEVGRQAKPETFRMYRDNEMSFDGLSDIGYMGYGIDIAFSEALDLALIVYTGPNVPSIVKKYDCVCADDAVDMWLSEWALALSVAAIPDNDNVPPA